MSEYGGPPVPLPDDITPPALAYHLGEDLAGGSAAPRRVDDFAGARLNEVLGGIQRRALIVVAGAPEVRAKKTAVGLEVAVHAAQHWTNDSAADEEDRLRKCPIYWLDSEVRGLHVTPYAEGADEEFALLQPRAWPMGFVEALALVPEDARILVVDDLEGWASIHQQCPPARSLLITHMMRLLFAHQAWMKIVNSVGGWPPEYIADAVVTVEARPNAYDFSPTKRRWDPCKEWIARHADAAGKGGAP